MISTALRIGASGLRSSCASMARNSSLRRSASFSAASTRARSAISPAARVGAARARLLARCSDSFSASSSRVFSACSVGVGQLEPRVGLGEAAVQRLQLAALADTARPAPRPCCAGSPAPPAPTRSRPRRACSPCRRSSSVTCTPVTKMIGVFSKRGCWWIRLAVSKPSMPGMLTSSRTTANSSLHQLLERLDARARAHQVLAEPLEDRLVGQQPRRLVVDQQDVDLARPSSMRAAFAAPQRCSHMRTSDSS